MVGQTTHEPHKDEMRFFDLVLWSSILRLRGRGTTQRVALACLAMATVAAGCGSTTPSSQDKPTRTAPTTQPHPKPSLPLTTTTTQSSAVAGQHVTSILSAGTSQVDQDKNISNTSQEGTALSKDFSNIANQLQGVVYPPNAQSDAKALVAIMNKVSYDAQ